MEVRFQNASGDREVRASFFFGRGNDNNNSIRIFFSRLASTYPPQIPPLRPHRSPRPPPRSPRGETLSSNLPSPSSRTASTLSTPSALPPRGPRPPIPRPLPPAPRTPSTRIGTSTSRLERTPLTASSPFTPQTRGKRGGPRPGGGFSAGLGRTWRGFPPSKCRGGGEGGRVAPSSNEKKNWDGGRMGGRSKKLRGEFVFVFSHTREKKAPPPLFPSQFFCVVDH